MEKVLTMGLHDFETRVSSQVHNPFTLSKITCIFAHLFGMYLASARPVRVHVWGF
jgi:hypothetical protein